MLSDPNSSFPAFLCNSEFDNVLCSCKMTSWSCSEHTEKGTEQRTDPLSPMGVWQSHKQPEAQGEPLQAGQVTASLGACLYPTAFQTHFLAHRLCVLARDITQEQFPLCSDDPALICTPRCCFIQPIGSNPTRALHPGSTGWRSPPAPSLTKQGWLSSPQ